MTKQQAAQILLAVKEFGVASVEHAVWANIRNNLPTPTVEVEKRYQAAEQRANDTSIAVHDAVMAAVTE